MLHVIHLNLKLALELVLTLVTGFNHTSWSQSALWLFYDSGVNFICMGLWVCGVAVKQRLFVLFFVKKEIELANKYESLTVWRKLVNLSKPGLDPLR